MPRCVEIEIDDAGKISVGLEPQEEAGYDKPKDHMKPIGSLDDALSVAKDLLSGQTGDQAQQAQDTDAAFQSGYSGKEQPAGSV